MNETSSTDLEFSEFPRDQLDEIDLSDFSNAGDALSTSVSCCDYHYVKDDKFILPKGMIQNNYHPKSNNCCGSGTEFASQFSAKIEIDATTAKIDITTQIKAVNSTEDTAYAGNVALSSEDYESAKNAALSEMALRWRRFNKKIIISTDKCKKTFQLDFHVIENSEKWHYEIAFINAPFEPDGRSNVRMDSQKAKFNFRDRRSVIGDYNPGLLETHEYGHMLGLPDEYFELVDYNYDGDGSDFRLRSFDPRDSRSIRVNKEDFSQQNVEDADRMFGLDSDLGPGEYRAGDSTWKTDRFGRLYLPGRWWYIQWERDIGGARYNWPNYTPYGMVSSPDNQGLMGAMSEDIPMRSEYVLPIVYAVAEIMTENGENVLEIKVE